MIVFKIKFILRSRAEHALERLVNFPWCRKHNYRSRFRSRSRSRSIFNTFYLLIAYGVATLDGTLSVQAFVGSLDYIPVSRSSQLSRFLVFKPKYLSIRSRFRSRLDVDLDLGQNVSKTRRQKTLE